MLREPSPFFKQRLARRDSEFTSHAEADHLWRLSAEAQRTWACKCWALAGYRKCEGVALSLQSLIQGRSEKEVVLKRVFYSQHSLPENKTNKQKPSRLLNLYRNGLVLHRKYSLECSFQLICQFVDGKICGCFSLRSGKDSLGEGQIHSVRKPSVPVWPSVGHGSLSPS